MPGKSYELWEIVEASPLIVRGVVTELRPEVEAEVRIDDVLKGPRPLDAALRMEAPSGMHLHVPEPDWRESDPVVVAFERLPDAPPLRPLHGSYGIVSLRGDPDAKVGAIRDLVRLLGSDDREAGAAALVSLLERPLELSQRAGLDAIRDCRRLEPLLGRAGVASSVRALAWHPEWTLRRDAAWACEKLPFEDVADSLIDQLEDEERWVRYAASRVLSRAAGQDLGFASEADRHDRALAVIRWRCFRAETRKR